MRVDASCSESLVSDQQFSYVGRGVILRPITFDDTAMIVRWRNEDAVKENLFTRDDVTSESHRLWLLNNVSIRKCDQFIVQLQGTGQPVGSAFLKDISLDRADGEFGIFLGKDGRGRGLAKEVTALLLEHAFETLGLQRVHLAVYSDNVAGIKAYKNVGFVEKPELGAEGADGRSITFMEIKRAQWDLQCSEK